MSGELDAAGTAIEGALLGAAVEPAHGNAQPVGATNCLNCGSVLNGQFCSACGQKAHVHRTLSAIWHDILHSVLHFDGKMWRTLPMLLFKPGELTRRYVHGERAKFVSPMALFLFSIFLMFAVFSFTGGPFSNAEGSVPDAVQRDFNSEAAKLDKEIRETEAKLADVKIPPAAKLGLQAKLNDLKSDRNGIAFAQTGKPLYPDNSIRSSSASGAKVSVIEGSVTGIDWLDNAVRKGGEKMVANPSLAFYKLQSNGYKFAWLLIPLSLPFVWLATLGVRGHPFYDHAVFTTYSISFMCLLFLIFAILGKLGVSENALGLAFVLIPPLHLYKQLRHAYSLTRPGALIRLIILSFFIWMVLILFASILLFLGMLG